MAFINYVMHISAKTWDHSYVIFLGNENKKRNLCKVTRKKELVRNLANFFFIAREKERAWRTCITMNIFNIQCLAYDNVKIVPVRGTKSVLKLKWLCGIVFLPCSERAKDRYIIRMSRKHPIRPQRRSGGRSLTFSQKTRSRCNETMKLVIGELLSRCRNPKENTTYGRYSSRCNDQISIKRILPFAFPFTLPLSYFSQICLSRYM